MSKNPDLANFLLHKKSVSTKKFVKSVFYVIFTVVKSVDYCTMKIHDQWNWSSILALILMKKFVK